ncbi:hypothetical protein [Actinomadura sp. HBU206391]|uniref:hypothetical protein n=1 Tax=Actinomadura sp. HBU206391 TaxID=2731692 RepID=UPI00164F72C7|nr:hypothetical protein [Actinomadura sp. HBU206391]MBC6458086.1 hypothetical protein [Actinomadura sp. HBU206391]
MKFTDSYFPLAEPPGEDGATDFLESDFGGVLEAFCGAVGVIIAVICIFRMINHITRGKPGDGFKTLVFGLIIGGMLFNLTMTIDAVGAMSGIVESAFDSVESVTGTGSD